MKNIALTLALCLSLQIVAQNTLPNSNFENWVSVTAINALNPIGWSTSNNGIPGGNTMVQPNSGSQNGNFAAMLQTTGLGFANLPYPGVMFNGEYPTDLPLNNAVLYMVNSGTPISTKPSSLMGYYKYSSSQNSDSAEVFILLKKYNIQALKSDTVAVAHKKLGSVANYTEFNMTINYINNQQPDSILVAIFSSSPSTSIHGGTLYIDNLQLKNDGTALESPIINECKINYLPASKTLSIINVMQPLELVISNLNGNIMYESKLSKFTNSVDIQKLPVGMYIVSLKNKGELAVTKTIFIAQ